MSERLKILDVWVDPLNRVTAMSRVRNYLENGTQPHSIFASNPEKNFSVPKDPHLYQVYKNADMLLPDGIGMVMAAKLLYDADISRVPGSELIFDICELASKEGYRVFVYGAKEDVNVKSVSRLKRRFPLLDIVGRSNGYVGEADMPLLVKKINDSKAEILFIALGSPRQEKWFANYKKSLKFVRVCQGVGGTLDTIGGHVNRAPKFWREKNLEWLYRLLTEPKRLRRQIVLPIFAFRVLKKWVGIKLKILNSSSTRLN